MKIISGEDILQVGSLVCFNLHISEDSYDFRCPLTHEYHDFITEKVMYTIKPYKIKDIYFKQNTRDDHMQYDIYFELVQFPNKLINSENFLLYDKQYVQDNIKIFGEI